VDRVVNNHVTNSQYCNVKASLCQSLYESVCMHSSQYWLYSTNKCWQYSNQYCGYKKIIHT